MTKATSDLLLEIGVEELPASFVLGALTALPDLFRKKLSELRLTFGAVRSLGTPRRLAVIVSDLALAQPDLSEEVTGPSAKAAFKDEIPTKAAESFAQKLGIKVTDLRRVDTPKGQYVVGTRSEKGRSTIELLPAILPAIAAAIPFRKSMRWGAGEATFGRPIQWIVALLGEEVVPTQIAGVASGRTSRGHRFLGAKDGRSHHVQISDPSAYVSALRDSHVIVDPEERATMMRDRLQKAAQLAEGVLIEDAFLVGENLSLVEEPHVVTGAFADEYLELPERVILEVAKGHQRYFGMRKKNGQLMPSYLSVVNTKENEANIRRGNDRVMRARLADAQFFYREDMKIPLAARRAKLDGIVFQKRLGTMLAKATRIERLCRELGLLLMLPEPTLMAAASGAHLAKCDLVSLMVGEFPELQGEMGRAYAMAQGVSGDVADVILSHYQPKGASDAVATTDAGALVAMADRLDSLAGCFAIGLAPTGATDPYGLRRACIGVLRTLLDRGFDLRLSDAFRAAYDGFEVKLDLSREDLVAKLGEFFADRMKGLLGDKLPTDAVLACLAVASDRPLDARARATAVVQLDAEVRSRVGEVFKRATNIAATAKGLEAAIAPPPEGAHASEVAVYEAFGGMRDSLSMLTKSGRYQEAFAEVAAFAPLLHQYFMDVFVMVDDETLRNNRLRLMRSISETCAALARFDLLGDVS